MASAFPLGKFRILRIPAPNSLWVACPVTNCTGMEIESGSTLDDVHFTISSHVRVHEMAQAP